MMTQIQDYKIIKLIGQGSFGSVYKVSKNNIFYALKMYTILNSNSKENSENEKTIENEIKILSQLDSPYIVKLYEVFTHISKDKNKNICLVLELCENGDLNDKIKEKKQKNQLFTENEILHYFHEILQGLYYLHKNKILHRDLKSLNIFLTKDNHVKIGDFGVSKQLISNNIYAYTFVGTPYYLSPEICLNKPYDEKSDIWSLGVLLYELITLNKPFEHQSQMGLFMKILKEKPAALNNTVKHSFSNKLISLVLDNMLNKDPESRYDIKQIISSGVFNKYLREKQIKERMKQKEKNKEKINEKNKERNKEKIKEKNNNNNLIQKNTNVSDKKIIRNNIHNIDSKRVRTNPMAGSKKTTTLSRRAQIATIPGKHTMPKGMSLHEQHLKLGNKYLNTFKEKQFNKGEPKITAKQYLHDVLINDNDNPLLNDETELNNVPQKKTNNNNNNNNEDTLNNNNRLIQIEGEILGNEIDEISQEPIINNDNINNLEENDNKIRPQFMLMNEDPNYINEALNRLPDDDVYESNDNILSELLNGGEYNDTSFGEEIPVLDNLENTKNITSVKDKEKKLKELMETAYEKYGRDTVEEILNKYEECQDNMNEDKTNELDELISNKMNGRNNKKYGEFLETFYKIIYIKYEQQIEGK